MMQIRLPELNVGIKAVRGLAYDGVAYAVRPDLIDLSDFEMGPEMVDLEAGKEVAITVEVSDLPVNANVQEFTATLRISAPDEQTGAGTTVAVKRPGVAEERYEISATTPEGPRGVALRLDGGEVFWSMPGVGAPGDYEVPNFAQQVNAYLDKAQTPPSGASLPLRFLARADTAGSAGIRIGTNRHTRLQTQSWANPLDDTIRLDRNLIVDFATTERFPLDEIAEARGQASVYDAIRIDVGGEVGNERLFGPIVPASSAQQATIDSSYAVAQLVEVESPLHVTGIATTFTVESDTELYLAIQADDAGTPSSATPLAKCSLTLVQPAEDPRAAWVYAAFDAALDIEPASRYWVVIKGVRGLARVGLDLNPPPHLGQACVNRGGQRWKPLGTTSETVAAQVRLVYEPRADNQTAAIEVAVEPLTGTGPVGPVQRLDPAPSAQTLALASGSAVQPLALVIRSHARGTLSLANVIQEYRAP